MRVTTLPAVSVALIVVAFAVFVAALTSGTLASAQTEDVTYTIKIENLTSGQPFTPPLIAAHTSDTGLFTVGEAASEGVKEIAENGNLETLAAAVAADSAVIAASTGDAAVLPGETATLTIDAPSGSYLSWVSMLICTNDGFVGIDSLALQATGSQTVDKDAYDAGTETNTEDFADIVPPCQDLIGVSSDDDGTGASNPDLAEGGVIGAHAGIQGSDDLTVADHGWTDPVARVTITAEEAPAAVPSTGGAPTSGSTPSWMLLAALGGATLIVLSLSTFAIARRTHR
ncbi:MAG: spondin domain-containing protein [Chloroflexi bacterium]|nr:spondin domain-containing protein [Chloroflexota bacterium]